MKIENIIEDIQRDILELKDKLEEQFRKENPELNFSVNVPGIEDLSTIKSITLSITDGSTRYLFSAQIHTHNGNRVFEHEANIMVNNQVIPDASRHPYQDNFVDLLRDIIKKNKNRMKAGNKQTNLYNDLRQYGNTG